MSGQPTRGTCTECGRQCRARSGVCLACINRHLSPEVLTGGRWVVVDGIQRWRPWTAAECAERTRQALTRWAA